MQIQIQNFATRIVDVHTRMPFKYGIATMTDVPHLFLHLQVSINHAPAAGTAADFLPPKWFKKDPRQPLADEINEMQDVILHAADTACHLRASTAFDLCSELAAQQKDWAAQRNIPPLLANFGVSLVERALIEAVCASIPLPFAEALDHPALGIRLHDIHSELPPSAPSRWLPKQPLPQITARHTIGLADPLTDDDIPAAEKLGDSLPHSLSDCIQRYRLRHFKIKVSGNPNSDLDRLRRCLHIIAAGTSNDFAFSIDGNEQFQSLELFQLFWNRLLSERWFSNLRSHLLFVEQPLHRSIALSPMVGPEMQRWPERPPIIIDESDADPSCLGRALELGYCGVSHKNCKGIFKGLAHRALLNRRSELDPRQQFLMTGEDLCTIGPVSLLQDLLLMSVLGIGSVERNGHHYCKGLSMFPPAIQENTLQQHPDLFHRSPAGFPTLNIRNGAIAVGSLLRPPFAVGFDAFSCLDR